MSARDAARPAPAPTAERWRVIEPLLDAVLDLPPERRGEFLDHACPDAALRAEVAALAEEIARDEPVPALDGDAPRMFAALLDDDPTAVAGVLAPALAGRFLLEGEIGRGGMATVYRARDLKHDRRVALKVLHAAFGAAVGAGRFLAEIRVTAGLQHPHIVPLFDSGEAAGLLYFVMPYVEGESLRDRLVRDPALGVDEALRIAGEVASALDYAHRRGVVHRDIKPENVLLSGGTAMVADFGIAKAIAAVGGDQPDGATHPRELRGASTAGGISLGTPSYMAPEQATGEPVDHRADLYAWGVTAYELLAGRHPFAGTRSAREMLAAHLAASPPPLATLRPDAPPAVAALVMRCLEKRAADRPASAAELLEAVSAARRESGRQSPGAALARRPAWRRPAAAAAVLVLLAGAYAAVRPHAADGGASLLDRGALRQRERVLVTDFRAHGADTALGGVLAEAARTNLAQSPVVSLVPASAVANVLRRMQRPADSRLDLALAREVAAREGIRVLVDGELAPLGQGYVVTLRLRTPVGDDLATVQETAADPQRLIAVVDELSRRLRGRIGESLRAVRAEQPLERVTTPSLEALRKYTLGVRAIEIDEDHAKGIALLEEAVALDTGFAMAYRKLGVGYWLRRRWPETTAALTRAYTHRDRLTDRERYLTEGTYHRLVTGDHERAVTAFRTLLDAYPDDWRALDNLATIYRDRGDWVRAAEMLRRELALDSLVQAAYRQLFWVSLADGREDEAAHTLALYRRRFPDDPEVDQQAAAHAWYHGRYDSVAVFATRMRGARKDVFRWRSTSDSWLTSITQLRGQFAETERRLRQTFEDAPKGKGLSVAFRLAELDLARDAPARAAALLDRALAGGVLDTLPPAAMPLAALATVYARAGRPARARGILAAFDRRASADARRAHEVERYYAEGVIALAEGRGADAVQFLQRWWRTANCAICLPPPGLGNAYELANLPDSAIVSYERYVEQPSAFRASDDRLLLPRTLYRLGELYEARGDSARAASAYARFADLWKDADPEVQPRVAEARRRVARLAPTDR